jgi:hypothetical protein
MRSLVLALVLSGCSYGYVPVRPARTVCSGSIVTNVNYATTASNCRSLPPDRCAVDSPTLEEDEASGYCEDVRRRNDRARSRERRDWIIAGSVLGALFVAMGAAAALQ